MAAAAVPAVRPAGSDDRDGASSAASPLLWVDDRNSPYAYYLDHRARVDELVPDLPALRGSLEQALTSPAWRSLVGESLDDGKRAEVASFVLGRATLSSVSGGEMIETLRGYGLVDDATADSVRETKWRPLSLADLLAAPKLSTLLEKEGKLDKKALSDEPWKMRENDGSGFVVVADKPTLRHLHAALHGALFVRRPPPPRHTIVAIDVATPLFAVLLPSLAQIEHPRVLFLRDVAGGDRRVVALALEARTLCALVQKVLEEANRAYSVHNGTCL